MSNGLSQRSDIADQRRQIGSQIVPASRSKLLHQIASPIGTVVFQAVTEDCVRRLVVKCLHQAISHGMEVSLDRVSIVVVEYETLGVERGALHCHPGAT